MRLYLKIFIFPIILLTINSCKDECETITEAPEEFLNYWFFPEESWWIYQRIDTTAVIYDTTFTFKYEDGFVLEGGCMKRYNVNIFHSYTNEFEQWISDGTYGNKRFLKIYNLGASNFTVEILYPFDRETTINQEYKIIDIITLSTPVGDFESTVHFEININREPLKIDLFLAPSAGVVKKVEPDGSIWELVDYHIEKK